MAAPAATVGYAQYLSPLRGRITRPSRQYSA